MKLVVGLWDAPGDLNKASERIGCGAIVVATLADAQKQIRQLIPQCRDIERASRSPGATQSPIEGTLIESRD
jgi:hypothetical protein